MKSGKLYAIGLSGLLTVGLLTTGCSDETFNGPTGSDQVISSNSTPSTGSAGVDDPINRTAASSATFDFKYETKFRTSIAAIDRKGGTLLVEYEPKFVKLDQATVIFARADVASKYDTGEGGSSIIANAKEIRLSLEDLSIGDKVDVYANVVNGHDLYAVAVEVIMATSGPSSVAE